MSGKKLQLSAEEIARPFQGEWAERFPPILSPELLAELIGLSLGTIREWKSKGRLDGAVRNRGKHTLIWRDRALDILFNGRDWPCAKRTDGSA